MTSNEVEITKAIIAGLATLGGASIIGFFGMRTAQNIAQAVEKQRRKAELYKILFAERIALGKKLSDLSGAIYQRCTVYYFGRDWDATQSELDGLNVELFNLVNSTEWLVSREVMQTAEALRDTVNDLIARRERLDDKAISTVKLKTTALSLAISKMMNDENVDHVMKNGGG